MVSQEAQTDVRVQKELNIESQYSISSTTPQKQNKKGGDD